MAKRSVATKKTLVDPMFIVPPGSEDEFAYSRSIADDDLLLDEEFLDGFDPGVSDIIELEVPEDFEVVEQKLRRVDSGQQVVDIVIEIQEIEGAINYEVQITKV